MNPKDIIDIETARECLIFYGYKCDNKDCKNKLCPLNKFWERIKKEREYESRINK
jgi:hypothetical protein